LRVLHRFAICLLATCPWACWLAPVAAQVAPAPAAAETAGVLQHDHAWARFDRGAWRHVRIVTENFDAQGKVTSSSTTDNVTTLEEVAPDHVTLKVEVTVEIGGQKFPSPPQVVHQGFAGESLGQTVSMKPIGAETLTVDGSQIPCEAQQIEIVGGGNKEVIEISFSPRSSPAILKRKSTTTDANSGETMQEAVTEVFALNRRLRVLDEQRERRGYRVRQVLKSNRGTTTSWSDHVPDVPGELVSQSSQKLDEQGRLLRRTTLELVDFGSDDEPRDMSRRARRHRRGR
jgi:hypothetical protein